MMANKEIEILSLLRQDSRRPLTEMSRRTQIPVSTLFAKLKEFRDSYIDRFTCILDYDKLGYGVITRMLFVVDKTHRDATITFLKNHESINSLYRINNGYDIMVEGVFESLHQAESFIETLESEHKIRKKQVHYIIEKVKEEGFLTTSWATV